MGDNIFQSLQLVKYIKHLRTGLHLRIIRILKVAADSQTDASAVRMRLFHTVSRYRTP